MSELTKMLRMAAEQRLPKAPDAPEDALAILALVAIAEGLEDIARAVAAGAVLASKGKP